ncbi:MAG: hypothetical protein CMO44_02670 [Verrucomicrobiales bacterium]|nr:hypothetical protein [Verrucomicrobiales bacterium]
MKRTKENETNTTKRQKLDSLQSVAAKQVFMQLEERLTNLSEQFVQEYTSAVEKFGTTTTALKQSLHSSDERETSYYKEANDCVQALMKQRNIIIEKLKSSESVLHIRSELSSIVKHELLREFQNLKEKSSTVKIMDKVYNEDGLFELMGEYTCYGRIKWEEYDDLVETMKYVVDKRDLYYNDDTIEMFTYPAIDWTLFEEEELLFVAFFWASEYIYFNVFNICLKEQHPEKYDTLKIDKYLRMGRGHFGFMEAMVILNGYNKSNKVIREEVFKLLNSISWFVGSKWSKPLNISTIRECNNKRICTVAYLKVQEKKKHDLDSWSRVGQPRFIKTSYDEFSNMELWARHREKVDAFTTYVDSMKHFDELQEWLKLKDTVTQHTASKIWNKLNDLYKDS